jgi:hypothetical protein
MRSSQLTRWPRMSLRPSRVRVLHDTIRAQERVIDDGRHLSAELIAAFEDACLIRNLVPQRWGGSAFSITTGLDISAEIGHASGSMGRVASLLMDHAPFMVRDSGQAHEDVWGAHGVDVPTMQANRDGIDLKRGSRGLRLCPTSVRRLISLFTRSNGWRYGNSAKATRSDCASVSIAATFGWERPTHRRPRVWAAECTGVVDYRCVRLDQREADSVP